MNEFAFNPSVAAPGLRAITQAADAAQRSHDTHQPEIRALEGTRPWGDDSIGKAFEENYAQLMPAVLEVWTLLCTELTQFSIGLHRAQEEALAANDAAKDQLAPG
jgi:hypothetical protein